MNPVSQGYKGSIPCEATPYGPQNPYFQVRGNFLSRSGRGIRTPLQAHWQPLGA